MRHAILGPGGIGGLLAAALGRAGLPVTLVVRPGTGGEFPRRIRLDSQLLGEIETEVTVTEQLTEPVDVLWVAVKAGQLAAALGQAPAALAGVVVPLLNGVDHLEPLRSQYGADRVATGTIRVEAERTAPGSFRQAGPLMLVELAGPPGLAEVLQTAVDELNEAGIQARLVGDGEHALWAKLIMLGPFALTSTASQLSLGEIAEQPRWRDLMVGAMGEIRAVAAAKGIELEPPVGMVNPAARGMRTSMQKDAAAGRPLELDHIAGPVLREGREHGVPTPVIEQLVAMVRARYPA
jgi:2-dehydropantoate 2-reductase